jgi:hypothetical protein
VSVSSSNSDVTSSAAFAGVGTGAGADAFADAVAGAGDGAGACPRPRAGACARAFTDPCDAFGFFFDDFDLCAFPAVVVDGTFQAVAAVVDALVFTISVCFK